MKKRFLVVALAVMLALALVPVLTTFGQEDKPSANDPIDACTPDQVNAMKPIVLPFVRGYEQVTESMQTVSTEDQVDQVITLANQMQISWWNEAVPQLPSCALSLTIQTTFGRLLDETLLAMIYYRVGASQDGTAHVQAMTALSQQVLSLSAEVQAAQGPAATEEATVEATAAATAEAGQ